MNEYEATIQINPTDDIKFILEEPGCYESEIEMIAHSSPPKSQATIDGVPCAQNLWILAMRLRPQTFL